MAQVVSYEIERYEVHLFVGKSNIGGNNYFDCEEDAINFALDYVKEHPGWSFKIFRIERARMIKVEH